MLKLTFQLANTITYKIYRKCIVACLRDFSPLNSDTKMATFTNL